MVPTSIRETPLPSLQTDGERLYVFIWKGTGQSVCLKCRKGKHVCVYARWVRLFVFPKEVRLCNKPGHYYSLADLLNKARSRECFLHISQPSPFPHITGEHGELSAHEMTRFYACQRKGRSRKQRIPASPNCSELQSPPLPNLQSQLSDPKSSHAALELWCKLKQHVKPLFDSLCSQNISFQSRLCKRMLILRSKAFVLHNHCNATAYYCVDYSFQHYSWWQKQD